MSWYKEAQNPYLSDNNYISELTPHIIPPRIGNENFDINANLVKVPFVINLDIKNWGIKDISVYATGTIIVHLNINQWGDEKDTQTEKDLFVDLSKLPEAQESLQAGVYTVTELELNLNEQFEVDYDNSSITIAKG